jgi:hypothetical protein
MLRFESEGRFDNPALTPWDGVFTYVSDNHTIDGRFA